MRLFLPTPLAYEFPLTFFSIFPFSYKPMCRWYIKPYSQVSIKKQIGLQPINANHVFCSPFSNSHLHPFASKKTHTPRSPPKLAPDLWQFFFRISRYLAISRRIKVMCAKPAPVGARLQGSVHRGLKKGGWFRMAGKCYLEMDDNCG